jgi:hypothetical protein
MTSLDEAKRWYDETRKLIGLIRRIGDQYWDDLPWKGKLERDERFKMVLPSKLVENADLSVA